jgi:hypothetical protein
MTDLNHPNPVAPDWQQLYIGWTEDGEWASPGYPKTNSAVRLSGLDRLALDQGGLWGNLFSQDRPPTPDPPLQARKQSCLFRLRVRGQRTLIGSHEPARASLLDSLPASYRAVQPPSIRIVSPVISDAAGDARNTTAPATSMGSPMRCSAAMRSTVSTRCLGSDR